MPVGKLDGKYIPWGNTGYCVVCDKQIFSRNAIYGTCHNCIKILVRKFKKENYFKSKRRKSYSKAECDDILKRLDKVIKEIN